ncbi:recombinase family protein [Peribacillus sp. SCS-155]|uniref:recombinase family protein n=1 Tax=Peribacillus sedimenti TaxID=3115297 RepID=UPI0039067882
MDKNRAIAYYRKSVKDGRKSKEEGVAYQQLKIREYADNNNLQVIKEFTDVGISGTKLKRPELTDLFSFLDDCDEQIHEVLIYSIDRLGRDTMINIDLISSIIEKVGKVTFVKQGISTVAEHFNMFFLIYSSMAQEERDILLGKLKDGRKSKVTYYRNFDGNYPPLGYSVDKKDGRLIINEDTIEVSEIKKQEVEIVRYIFMAYLFDNSSLRQIAKDLNHKFGLTRRGATWNYKSVQWILQNKAYIGVLSGGLNKSEHYYIPEANV